MASTGEVLGSAEERDGISTEEARLARLAAAGDGAAFTTLYDRYESRIYNFCNRLLGSPEDAADATQDAFLKVLQRLPKLEGRELNFSAYLFTAARNASYDMIGKRKKATPVDEIPEPGGGEGAREPGDLDLDPERTAMLDSQQEEIRAANDRLPERQREVLALRELEDKSYDEIAEVMGMNRNSVAQLISRARIKLRDELRGSALSSVAVSSPDCQRALPLIAARGDGQLTHAGDAAWLEEHLGACDTCSVSEQAMEEAGTSYRAWLPLVPILWLRRETIAKAGELVGADWSRIADSARPGGGEGGPGEDGPSAAGPSDGGSNGAGSEGGGPAAGDESRAARLRRALRDRRRASLALLGALALLLGIFAAIVVGDDGTPAAPDKTEGPGSRAGALLTTTTDANGNVKTVKKKPAEPSDPTSTGSTVVTTTLPSGEVTTKTLPAQRKNKSAPKRKPAARRRQGGSNAGGGGGVVNLPTASNPTTTSAPPPTTTSAPPPTTSTPTSSTPRCAPGIAGCPGGTGTTTTTQTPRLCRDPRTGALRRC